MSSFHGTCAQFNNNNHHNITTVFVTFPTKHGQIDEKWLPNSRHDIQNWRTSYNRQWTVYRLHVSSTNFYFIFSFSSKFVFINNQWQTKLHGKINRFRCGGDGQMKCDPKVCTPEPMLRQMIASAKRR